MSFSQDVFHAACEDKQRNLPESSCTGQVIEKKYLQSILRILTKRKIDKFEA